MWFYWLILNQWLRSLNRQGWFTRMLFNALLVVQKLLVRRKSSFYADELNELSDVVWCDCDWKHEWVSEAILIFSEASENDVKRFRCDSWRVLKPSNSWEIKKVPLESSQIHQHKYLHFNDNADVFLNSNPKHLIMCLTESLLSFKTKSRAIISLHSKRGPWLIALKNCLQCHFRQSLRIYDNRPLERRNSLCAQVSLLLWLVLIAWIMNLCFAFSWWSTFPQNS